MVKSIKDDTGIIWPESSSWAWTVGDSFIPTSLLTPTEETSIDRFLKMSNEVITFDDVLLVPQYSEINSRKSIDISSSIDGIRFLDIPIIAANMDSVSDNRMAIAMSFLGGLGVIHRYMSKEEQIKQVKIANNTLTNLILSECPNKNIAVAIGIKEDNDEILNHVVNLVSAGIDYIFIDVAHGHHSRVLEVVTLIRDRDFISNDNLPLSIIAGNVVTEEGAEALLAAGAHCIKVGIGSGSICSTRTVTGHGFPQLESVAKIRKEFPNCGLISDGGIKCSGDIVKVLAAGADAVMIGSLLAGTDESPGEVFIQNGEKVKRYRGMASNGAQKDYFGNNPDAPEGVTTLVPYKGSVKKIISNLCGGIRSGLSYSGAENILELKEKADWILISNNGYRESLTLPPIFEPESMS